MITQELNYIRRALSKGTIYQYDAIVWIVDTLVGYLEEDGADNDK